VPVYLCSFNGDYVLNKISILLLFFLTSLILYTLTSCKDEKVRKQQELVESIEILGYKFDIDYPAVCINKKMPVEPERINLGYFTVNNNNIKNIIYENMRVKIFTNTFIFSVELPQNFEIFCELGGLIKIDDETYQYPEGEDVLDFSKFGIDKQIILSCFTKEDFNNSQTFKAFKNVILTKILKEGEVKKLNDEEFEEYYNSLYKKLTILLCVKALIIEQDSFNAIIQFLPTQGARGKLWNKEDSIFHNIRITPIDTTLQDIEAELIEFILSIKYNNLQNITLKDNNIPVEKAMNDLKIIKN